MISNKTEMTYLLRISKLCDCIHDKVYVYDSTLECANVYFTPSENFFFPASLSKIDYSFTCNNMYAIVPGEIFG